jgi:hypothetical protein
VLALPVRFQRAAVLAPIKGKAFGAGAEVVEVRTHAAGG